MLYSPLYGIYGLHAIPSAGFKLEGLKILNFLFKFTTMASWFLRSRRSKQCRFINFLWLWKKKLRPLNYLKYCWPWSNLFLLLQNFCASSQVVAIKPSTIISRSGVYYVYACSLRQRCWYPCLRPPPPNTRSSTDATAVTHPHLDCPTLTGRVPSGESLRSFVHFNVHPI